VSSPGLRVRALSVSYGHLLAVRSVDLDAPAGVVTGIVGPNGAGKSTLLKATVGLVRTSAGSVTVNGNPVDAERSRIAYLAQRAAVDWDYPATVRDVVAMGRYPHLRLLQRFGSDNRARVTDALRRVRMSELADRRVGELSGGQQQRVFLARALAQEARLLLLDEPFAGVDTVTIELLRRLLTEVASGGATVVIVNHDLDVVRTFCDNLVLLNRRVVAAGAPDDVLDPATLARTYGSTPTRAVAPLGAS